MVLVKRTSGPGTEATACDAPETNRGDGDDDKQVNPMNVLLGPASKFVFHRLAHS